jgi:hypothetical protein
MKNTLSRLMNKGHWLNLMLAAVIFSSCEGMMIPIPPFVVKSADTLRDGSGYVYNVRSLSKPDRTTHIITSEKFLVGDTLWVSRKNNCR